MGKVKSLGGGGRFSTMYSSKTLFYLVLVQVYLSPLRGEHICFIPGGGYPRVEHWKESPPLTISPLRDLSWPTLQLYHAIWAERVGANVFSIYFCMFNCWFVAIMSIILLWVFCRVIGNEHWWPITWNNVWFQCFSFRKVNGATQIDRWVFTVTQILSVFIVLQKIFCKNRKIKISFVQLLFVMEITLRNFFLM
jgi:hypothetical protein